MFKQAILLRDIIPDDQAGKKNPKFYPKGETIQINPLGYYIEYFPRIGELSGWMRKSLTDSSQKLELIEGVDYKLI